MMRLDVVVLQEGGPLSALSPPSLVAQTGLVRGVVGCNEENTGRREEHRSPEKQRERTAVMKQQQRDLTKKEIEGIQDQKNREMNGRKGEGRLTVRPSPLLLHA